MREENRMQNTGTYDLLGPASRALTLITFAVHGSPFGGLEFLLTTSH